MAPISNWRTNVPPAPAHQRRWTNIEPALALRCDGTLLAPAQYVGEPMISEAQVWDALREVRDPEIDVSIVDLGLVYGVTVEARSVRVALTMTTPACPLSGYIAEVAEDAIRRRDPAAVVEVAIVWEPPWTPDLLSEEAKRRLGRTH